MTAATQGLELGGVGERARHGPERIWPSRHLLPLSHVKAGAVPAVELTPPSGRESSGDDSPSRRPESGACDRDRRGRDLRPLGVAGGSRRWAIRWAKPRRIGPYQAQRRTLTGATVWPKLQVFRRLKAPRTPCFTRERSQVRNPPRPSARKPRSGRVSRLRDRRGSRPGEHGERALRAPALPATRGRTALTAPERHAARSLDGGAPRPEEVEERGPRRAPRRAAARPLIVRWLPCSAMYAARAAAGSGGSGRSSC
jgi:hypothetical protein